MNKLFECANQYVEQCDWKDLAMLKGCLCAIGVLIGISVPREKRKPFLIVAGIVFIATYIPLMTKFVKVVKENFTK